ncbi:FliI/YscN family ATPase [Edaphobacter sp. 12200R-103]|uniref:FliI/YscN family ATPase n=1 Tax=Edaphobacter sp. 12200R-103 TaxID=2703788 RepID=UPI00138DCB3B|nr:FliI/YscN family ATPase [Edaphobacter sp. 12200R-103]
MQSECENVEELLRPYFAHMARGTPWRWTGRVIEANGQTIESEGPLCSVGECCEIMDADGRRHRGEVIGFRGRNVLAMSLEATRGIRYGDALAATGISPGIAVGDGMEGRVLDSLGLPLDGLPALRPRELWPLDGAVPHPMQRVPIREAMSTGVRVLDGMLTVGRGQRIGIFGGSGVGKSTLIGMMTRNTAADLTVVGLVGERGREVREFVEDSLGEEGMKRAIVLVSSSDQSPLLRMRAALAATAVAEYHASQGRHVLLVLDSLTRYAMAAREIGLAAGEPPATKGYTPSVFTKLAKLVERVGNFEHGSITAFYTVLMEGDDQQDPVVDSVRSFVDGHVVLSRQLASAGWYPPVNVLDSLSRLMPAVVSRDHREQAAVVRRLLAAHTRSEDLVRIGAYRSGADPELDRAMQAMPVMRSFLEQGSEEKVRLEDTVERLMTMVL